MTEQFDPHKPGAQMSAYEELVDRCYLASEHAVSADIRAILAEVLRTLESVTPEMVDAEMGVECDPNGQPAIGAVYLAVLRASPLAPPVRS